MFANFRKQVSGQVSGATRVGAEAGRGETTARGFASAAEMDARMRSLYRDRYDGSAIGWL